MTLNGVIALILHYLTEFDKLGADYVAVVEVLDRPIWLAQNILFQLYFGQTWPTEHGLFATAKLLV